MPSKERQTADRLVKAFNTLDTDTIISLRTPTCTRIFLPSSLPLSPQSNAAYQANLDTMKSIFTTFQVTVHDVIEGISTDAAGTERKKIVMFVSAFGETPVGEYRNEYVWRMAFSEDGEKIDEWTEYVDATMHRDFYPKLRGLARKKAEETQGQ